MRKITNTSIFMIIGVLYFASITAYGEFYVNEPKIVYKEIPVVKIKKLTYWDKLIIAIETVESGRDTTKIGTKNDVGCLQLTPIYVKEVNRILGDDTYCLNDRFNREKSIEMFNILQSYHNPNKKIDKAIKLHNPGAPSSYKQKILKIYKTL